MIEYLLQCLAQLPAFPSLRATLMPGLAALSVALIIAPPEGILSGAERYSVHRTSCCPHLLSGLTSIAGNRQDGKLRLSVPATVFEVV